MTGSGSTQAVAVAVPVDVLGNRSSVTVMVVVPVDTTPQPVGQFTE